MRRLALTRLVFERRQLAPGHAFPDDPCTVQGCAGKLYVYDSRQNKETGLRTRYLRCSICRDCPDNNKWVD
jgi:hypothetical protein